MFKPKFYSESENIVKRRKAGKLRLKFPEIVKDSIRRNLFDDITNVGPKEMNDENARDGCDQDYKELVKENSRDDCNQDLVIDETKNGNEQDVKTESDVQDNIELCRFDLGSDRYVVAKKFNGKTQIHIREYAHGNNGLYPTRKGIALDLYQWKQIDEMYCSEIAECIDKKEDYKQHLGANVYVTMQKGFQCVNIRKWFLPPDETNIVPTRKGIALTFQQWNNLKGAVDLVGQILKDQLDEIEFCDHQNQMGFFTCMKCNPNNFMNY
ncbi:hypothetical protein KUTeg_017220 [Tegillarca granosa]|uniref:Transcriptional coactivator p15 (PC4) C-terminal domain-containing protein n=1 Tax=Tegillarca granosa TaxID=220873 RepID=A0ABQ9EIW7_TEGGR|nr:hypothetical protein KUTeg_017220 [Tegillarca granosa]